MKNNYIRLPWFVIFLIFFIFFPVGILLIVYKLTNEKDRYYKNSMIVSYLLITLLMLSIIGYAFVFGYEESFNPIPFFAVLFIIFFPMAVYVDIFRRRALRFDLYSNIISNTGTDSIDRIAKISQKNFNLVCKDLQIMVEAEILWNTSLDLSSRKLIYPKESNDEEIKTIIVNCPNCGATGTKKSNEIINCIYCDTPL